VVVPLSRTSSVLSELSSKPCYLDSTAELKLASSCWYARCVRPCRSSFPETGSNLNWRSWGKFNKRAERSCL